MTGLYTKCIFNFLKKMSHYFQKWLYHYTFSPADECTSPSTSLSTLDMISRFTFSHSITYVVIPHQGFNVHFPNDQWVSSITSYAYLLSAHIVFGECFSGYFVHLLVELFII